MFNLTPTVRNLLFLNIIVFFLQYQFGERVTAFGSLYPVGSVYFHAWQFVTYMFLHGGLGHIFFNMFALITFGPLLEQRWGGNRFLAYWLICGVGAGALYEGVRGYELNQMNQARQEFRQSPSGGDFADFFRTYYPEGQGYESVALAMQRHPDDQGLIASANATIDTIYNQTFNSPMLGASGAIFGLLLAFGYLFPNTELFLLFPPIPIKAKYLVIGYGLFELYSGVHRTPGDNVAHYAHLGGMLIGFIVLKFWERNSASFY